MDLIAATLGFIVLAGAWAFILFGTLKNFYNIKRRSLILVMFFFMALALILLVLGAVMEYIESPEFCGTACHPTAGLIVDDTPMEPYYDSYISPGNNEFMATHNEEEVTCSKCHDNPGAIGKAQAFAGAFVEVVNYVSGNYDADNLETHFENKKCEKCHDGEHADKPGTIIGVNNLTVDPHDNDKKCNSCHIPHEAGMGFSEEACASCHDVSINELESHGITAGTDCMACHDRAHPDNAMLSFGDFPELIHDTFCADCHKEVYDNYSSWPDARTAFYGDCTTSCHKEHKGGAVPHQILDDNETNCKSCHIYDIASHFPQDIIFYNYTAEIGNDFCGDCHKNEFDIYSGWYADKLIVYGSCTTLCHKTHSKDAAVPHLTTPPYEEHCDTCHLLSKSSHEQKDAGYANVEFDIGKEFCGDCHADELKSLSNSVHDSRDCIECHKEHETVSTDFESCTMCHTAIPENHDEKKTSCGICHSIDMIHGT